MQATIRNGLFLMAVCAISAAPAFPADKVQDVISPLPAGSVRLHGGLDGDIRNSIEHWSKGGLPYSRFVDFFRNGRPQFALGEMWGKAVRSGAMFYRYTHDPELREILRTTVYDLISATRPNGSISCVPPERQPDDTGGDLWERKYVMLGLSQYYKQVEADPAVMEAMKREAQSIIDQIGPAPRASITSLGWSANKIESSSLLEPMMRLYKLTGDGRYLSFAEYIIRSGGCSGSDIFAQVLANVPPREMAPPYPKAYEMTSIFEGVVEYYRATGDERMRQCFENYYNNVRSREITIAGNGGADQPYFPQWAGEAWDDTRLEQTNPKITRMMETCTGVTWMKFCSQVLRITGNPQAADDIERYVYNGLLGAMKPTGDGFSYVNLLNGNKVTNQGWGWNFDGKPVTCCNLNGPMGLAYIPLVAVMQRADGPVVNLYNSATATAKTAKGTAVELEIATDFPRSNKVAVTVSQLKKREKFAVSLRIPAWSKNTVATVNGRRVAGVESGKYLSISRKWKRGDRIDLTLDMQASLVAAPHGSNPAGNNFQAVTYGPIVLARDENTDPGFDKPVRIAADADGSLRITPVKPTLAATRMEFSVPTATGSIRMVDYASVNGWTGKRVCTWMPLP